MGYKNKQDLYEYQKRRWVNRKVEAILYKGGKCAACGIEYNGENGAIFDFHHINPEEKELDKEICLCSNCHRLIHSQKF